ncbi:hypothetical protein L249_7558 [Ophiocordyceps polyrhachis-furcata BCC 54312]|uniref:Uncharacterized protein n=1 Tax=Ophiocordyceps polyrhachis-furcata BCC 54312 TaxID=1330021 RepID=A0A367LBQ4_9HYPO|nr:hypothetical protein L249_7558 [Ophiocordyceps polyrhachis-furcata BCC 54312]
MKRRHNVVPGVLVVHIVACHLPPYHLTYPTNLEPDYVASDGGLSDSEETKGVLLLFGRDEIGYDCFATQFATAIIIASKEGCDGCRVDASALGWGETGGHMASYLAAGAIRLWLVTRHDTTRHAGSSILPPLCNLRFANQQTKSSPSHEERGNEKGTLEAIKKKCNAALRVTFALIIEEIFTIKAETFATLKIAAAAEAVEAEAEAAEAAALKAEDPLLLRLL